MCTDLGLTFLKNNPNKERTLSQLSDPVEAGQFPGVEKSAGWAACGGAWAPLGALGTLRNEILGASPSPTKLLKADFMVYMGRKKTGLNGR